jgi:hypothetical protein
MDILKKLRKGKKPLSADVIALLAQAHQIHQAELAFARDEARTELRQKIRDALQMMTLMDKDDGRCWYSSAEVEDRYLFNIGSLFCETPEDRAEWSAFVRERRITRNDQKAAVLAQQIDRALGRKRGNRQDVPYQAGEHGTHASGGVVTSW